MIQRIKFKHNCKTYKGAAYMIPGNVMIGRNEPPSRIVKLLVHPGHLRLLIKYRLILVVRAVDHHARFHFNRANAAAIFDCRLRDIAKST